MSKHLTILSQMQEYFSRYQFEKLVFDHKGDKWIKNFSTFNLLQVMIYLHLTAKSSLRDICIGLKSLRNYWYHLGLRSISRNNLSNAMMKRSSLIFEKMFYLLLNNFYKETKRTKDKRFRFKNSLKSVDKNSLKSVDSSTISLCLSIFGWAKFRKKKGGIKLHVMYDNKEQLPDFVTISDGKKHDIRAAREMPIKKDSIYVYDKAYLSFRFINKVNNNGAFFVTRAKKNTQYKIISRNKKTNKDIKADWIIELTGTKAGDYQGKLRLIKFYDREKKKTFAFLTNNCKLSAKTIADIYKARWDIELFFKWIKQNLKIKKFIGTSENAVLLQIWSAMITYLLLAFIKYKTKSDYSPLNKIDNNTERGFYRYWSSRTKGYSTIGF